METRIESRQGVFVVYDAADVADVEEEFLGYLAYWDDFEAGTLFLFGRLLPDRLDVGQALDNLQRDLAVDLVIFRAKNFMLDSALSEAAVENPDATQWYPATRNLIRELVGCSGPSVGAGDSDGIVRRQYPCYSTAPPSPPPNDSSKPPDPRRPPEAEPAPIVTPWPCDAVDQSLRIACACGGGTPPPPPPPTCEDLSCQCCPYGVASSAGGDCCPMESPRLCDDCDPCTVNDLCYLFCKNPSDPTNQYCCAEPMDCDDGDFCIDDYCVGGSCRYDPYDYCDDGNPCTDDSCDPADGSCLHMPNSAPCPDDGNPCTYDICSDRTCTHPVHHAPCDDGNPCTDDFCDPWTGNCQHIPVGGACPDDEDLCTDDWCEDGASAYPPHCPPAVLCCEGNCCTDPAPPAACCGSAPALGCCGATCCWGVCINDTECCSLGNPCPAPPPATGEICCDACDSCSATGCCPGTVCLDGSCCVAMEPRARKRCAGASEGTVDVANGVLGVLDKFANVANLQKARADLEPSDFDQNNGPDFKVNVANDVLYCLAAFTGGAYPFSPGDPCGKGLKLSRAGR